MQESCGNNPILKGMPDEAGDEKKD
jgi:hypothetical protein